MKFKVGDKVRVYQGHATQAAVIGIGFVISLDETLGHLTDLLEVEIEHSNNRILVRELQCEKVD